MVASHRDPLTARGGRVSPAAAERGRCYLGIKDAENGALRILRRARVYISSRARADELAALVCKYPALWKKGVRGDDDRVLGTAAASRQRPPRGCNVAVLEDR